MNLIRLALFTKSHFSQQHDIQFSIQKFQLLSFCAASAWVVVFIEYVSIFF